MNSNTNIAKCSNPNLNIHMCRQCQRSTKNIYEQSTTFNLKCSGKSNYECDGYVSKKETKTLFDK